MRYNSKASKASEQVCPTFFTFNHVCILVPNSLLNVSKSPRKNFDRKNGAAAVVCPALPGEVIEIFDENVLEFKANPEPGNLNLFTFNSKKSIKSLLSSVPEWKLTSNRPKLCLFENKSANKKGILDCPLARVFNKSNKNQPNCLPEIPLSKEIPKAVNHKFQCLCSCSSAWKVVHRKVKALKALKGSKGHEDNIKCKRAGYFRIIFFRTDHIYLRNQRSHTEARIRASLQRSGDVHPNPGPEVRDQERVQRGQGSKQGKSAILVTSYNVRGLNDERKLRHLLNVFHRDSGGKNVDSIMCLQETYIANLGILPYVWRGNYHLTPGAGNSCGCVTLISSHLSIVEKRDINDRAHVIVCQRSNETRPTYVIANLYAPNPNNNEKLEFFETALEAVLELAEKHSCSKIIIAGDLNLVFRSEETKNRNYSAQEKRMASWLKDRLGEAGLVDCWDKKPQFTWRRPNSDSFSTIDRVIHSKDTLNLDSVVVDWALGFSDHAAVRASYSHVDEKIGRRSRITRLDPTLAKSPFYGPIILEQFNEMISTTPEGWSPHMLLEFAKVCIRTIAEKLQSDRKKEEATEENFVNEELEIATKKLAESQTDGLENLIEYVEELRARKSKLIDERGERLAARTGTRWYNEGEKSNKYFMRLLSRAMPDDFKIIEGEDGATLTEPKDIETAIVNFYKDLYENVDLIQNDQDRDFFNNIEQISGADDAAVSAQLTLEELRGTLGSCVDSSPGPDGIPYSYIALLWPTFGKILLNAWNYSLLSETLPPSHKISFLKLIPKTGKDLKKLTNWRPITLSNCDHKLITKTYAKRLCDKVAEKITESQTAYIKGRLINDNIRAMLSVINLTNIEEGLEGVIVSLDAKKAFDSVDHNYIEKCLVKFGCVSFVPIFKTLYRGLRTDILVNGKIIEGFNIKRGVKQGDALSCILFIMCIEPLLRNIEANPDIACLNSQTLNASFPKTFAYADDVCGIVKDDGRSVQAIFKEYERLTSLSGLELNADKTELMRLGRRRQEQLYQINYRERNYELISLNELKINGIFFQNDRGRMMKRNIESILEKMDKHLKSWSRRSLSTLGKILIAKTFGISQVIYLLQSVAVNSDDVKKINALLYKFIWNRHYQAAKAPERIKREICTKPLIKGGLGMLDVAELDASLKIKAVGRMLSSRHPFLQLVRTKTNLESYFNPSCIKNLDSVIEEGLNLLKKDRGTLWDVRALDSDRKLLETVRNAELKDIVEKRGLNSIPVFNLRVRGLNRIGQLSGVQLESLIRHIEGRKMNKLRAAIRAGPGPNEPDFGETYYTKKVHKNLSSLTSKEIRIERASSAVLTSYKIGLDLTVPESLSWCHKISKLTSVRHKNLLMKIAHGDIYTREKLLRFGMTDTDSCPRCQATEGLKHKFVDCDYIQRIWRCSIPYLVKLSSHIDPLTDPLRLALGANRETTMASLTLNAEILDSIIKLKPDTNYVIRPSVLVKAAIKNLSVKEGNLDMKRQFIEALDD